MLYIKNQSTMMVKSIKTKKYHQDSIQESEKSFTENR
jgi:hypothetical protein